VLAQAPEPHPPEVAAALDALVPFLDDAIAVVDGYAGRPFAVTIVFERGRAEPAAEADRGHHAGLP